MSLIQTGEQLGGYKSIGHLCAEVINDGEEPLVYELLGEKGPDHNKTFEVRALIGTEEIGRGTGRTKKAAEAMAAYKGILKLKEM